MNFIFNRTLAIFVKVFLLLTCCSFSAIGQVGENDLDYLSKEFHAGRRDALRKLMADSSVAVFFSGSIKNRSNDIDYEYHQDPDFYYLTGLNEPGAILFVFKNEVEIAGELGNEILFVKERNPKTERWTGTLLGTSGGKQQLGFQKVFSSDDFLDFNLNFSIYKKIYVLDKKSEDGVVAINKQFAQKLLVAKVISDSYFLKESMSHLREEKLPEEVTLLKKAISITCNAITEAMKGIEPGMKEYNAEAIVEYIFKSQGAEDFGYPSILGGGENSCILHYASNRKKLFTNDLLLCDVGAEYHGYSADVTRTFPINGKFSEEQKNIYTIVLDAQNAGISKCKPGEDFRSPHNAAMEVIQKNLLKLGIIKTPGEVSKYFFHGTSHYLGLDVHDVGMYGKLKPSNVITVEPGIYIPFGSDCDEKWWGIGIRIEDDVLITDTEPDVLSSCVPKTIAEIELLMKEESLFNLIKK